MFEEKTVEDADCIVEKADRLYSKWSFFSLQRKIDTKMPPITTYLLLVSTRDVSSSKKQLIQSTR